MPLAACSEKIPGDMDVEPKRIGPTPRDAISPADERVARNEMRARIINEAIEEGRGSFKDAAGFICECGSLGCNAVVELTLAAYEAVRADARQFLVVDAHKDGFDAIVHDAGAYSVVRARRIAGNAARASEPGLQPEASVTTAHGVPAMAFEFDATPESVPRARALIRAFVAEYSANRDVHARIELAFTEAFTNAVRHAYSELGGTVRVAADIDDGALEIVVDDDGCGFVTASSARPGLGAGLMIIAESADAFGIRGRRPNGTEVWMRFTIEP